MANTTSKTKKTDVAEKAKVAAATTAATEKAETVAEAKTETATVEKGTTATTAATEKAETVAEAKTETKSGLPFKVNSDGTVNVWSRGRAGKSVIGSTGKIVTFDDKGFAVAALEDALHFQKVPGFSFTEEK